jgi:pantoate kinase
MTGLRPSATAFAPGHITGFFVVYEHSDPRFAGATGCGLVLDKGISTTVRPAWEEADAGITLNGLPAEAPVTARIVEQLTDIDVRVDAVSGIPVECGFGASAAGGLSAACALNDLFSLNFSRDELGEIVHVAEVLEGGGLGDVEAIAHGGVVIRQAPGPLTTTGKLALIPAPPFEVFCVAFGPISTGEVLGSPAAVEHINSAGKEAMKALLARPTVNRFMGVSREFARKAGLMDDRIADAIEAVVAAGGLASQAMIGNTVFAIAEEGSREDVKDVKDALGEFGQVLGFTAGGNWEP